MQHRKALGNKGEDLISEKLVEKGYAILARNYRKPYGEIDVIAAKNDLVLFIEVKTRHNPNFDFSEIITYSKQRKIVMVAKQFIAAHNITDKTFRFDVALVKTENNHLKINYIPNAFEGRE